jgi:hypothetical protein
MGAAPTVTAESVMEPGPSTVRFNTLAADLVAMAAEMVAVAVLLCPSGRAFVPLRRSFLLSSAAVSGPPGLASIVPAVLAAATPPLRSGPQLGALLMHAVTDDDRAGRRLVRRNGLEPADAVPRERPELLSHRGRDGRDRVVVRRLDPHDARRLRRAEPERKHRSERDRDLPDEVARATSTDNALDSVDMRDRLQATLEHDEQRTVVTLVDRVLARHEPQVRGRQ